MVCQDPLAVNIRKKYFVPGTRAIVQVASQGLVLWSRGVHRFVLASHLWSGGPQYPGSTWDKTNCFLMKDHVSSFAGA